MATWTFLRDGAPIAGLGAAGAWLGAELAIGLFSASPGAALAPNMALGLSAGIGAALGAALGLFLARGSSPFQPLLENAIAPPPSAPPSVALTTIEPPVGSDLLAALPEPTLLIDASLRITAANPLARALFDSDMVGIDVRRFLRAPSIIEALTDCQRLGSPQTRDVHIGAATERTYSIAMAPLPEPDQRLLVVMRDITAARLTERMRVDFVANASHELRTPLSTLIGFIETLQGAAADDKDARVRFLDIMGAEANRMARLIEDLLSLSRIELNKHESPDTLIDLPPLIRDVGKTLAMRLSADERRLDQRLPTQCPQVLADRDQILQVLHNLISNAIKYGRSGTPIELSIELIAGAADLGDATTEPELTAQQPKALRVAVTDQGDGIAPEHIPRLTERFFRVDTARSRTLGGTGLGLAIVKHIVDRHRGSLSIQSIPGKGTTVSFTLPTAANASPALRPASVS
jgi:two-component system, OmpR family, phosphate regulon sensor histidine kinase PhoR